MDDEKYLRNVLIEFYWSAFNDGAEWYSVTPHKSTGTDRELINQRKELVEKFSKRIAKRNKKAAK